MAHAHVLVVAVKIAKVAALAGGVFLAAHTIRQPQHPPYGPILPARPVIVKGAR